MSHWKTYQNGNYTVKINLLNGTKIRETEEDDFKSAFAENIDIKICDHCDIGCSYCHEGSTPNSSFGDLKLPFLDSLHPFQEVAIGGGDATSHPDLIPFLEALKAKEVIANLTVHQTHFIQKQSLIEHLVSNRLIYGLGVSLVNPSEEFISLAKKYPNLVLHSINGILTQSQVERLANQRLKLLILGYKHLRRGNNFFEKAEDSIKRNQSYLETNLKEIVPLFKVVSFDNLAIEQLNVKSLMSEEQWNEFYMGDDGSATFYIDMVSKTFAKNSTAPFENRYSLLDSVDEMFNRIRTNS